MNISFHGKRIIITGASQGLGAIAASSYAEGGATIALLGRDKEKLDTVRQTLTNSNNHHSIVVDLLNLAEIQGAIGRAISALGGVDIVLHAAGGGLGLRDPLLPYQDFQTLFNLNVLAAAEINRQVCPLMEQQKSGNIIHVGSIASLEVVGSVGYNTVKAGIVAYVRSLGRLMAAHQVVVTGVLPGGFISEGNAMDRLQQRNPEVYDKFIQERLPRKHMGKAEEVIPMILLLSSSYASMMGGCLVPIDAGEGIAYLQQ